MRKNGVKNILWLAGGIFFLALNSTGAVTIPEISETVSPDRIPLGENAQLTISAVWEGDDSEFVFLKPQPPECRGLEVTGTSQRSITFSTNGVQRQAMEYIFTLKGTREGTAGIGEVTLPYHRLKEETEHSLTSRPIEIVVTSGGTGLSFSPGSILIIVGLGIVIIIIIAFYARWTVRRYKKKSNEILTDYVKNLEIDSLKELDQVRKYKVKGETGKYLEKIWDILADYLEKKYTLAISPDTWTEVLGGRRASELSEESKLELSRILKSLEESRFGSYQPDNQELDAILKRAYSFIENQE